MTSREEAGFPILWDRSLKTFVDHRATGRIRIDSETIRIDVVEKGAAVQQEFKRKDTKISWIGKSGKRYNFFSWILLQDSDKSCYITHGRREKRFSLNWDKLSREDTSKIFGVLKVLGYDTNLDMPTFAFRKRLLYLAALIVLGLSLYIFTAEEVESKGGTLSETEQIFFGCLILVVSLFLACAGYFGIRNHPPLTEKELAHHQPSGD